MPRISQPKVLSLLISGQILSGLGVGINVAAGTIIIKEITENESWSGFAVTVASIGAAVSSIPLAKIASTYGRRMSLSVGMFVAALGAMLGIYATSVGNIWLVLLAFFLLGVAQATSLQARFAATDLSRPEHRGRDLSLITWSTVIGATAGPNLLDVGIHIGQFFGLTGMAGVFIPPICGQLSSSIIFFVLMRPDPLLQARRDRETIQHDAQLAKISEPEVSTGSIDIPAQDLVPSVEDTYDAQQRRRVGNMQLVVVAITAIALSQWVMTALMSMTPVHIDHHGGDMTIIGITISLHIAGMYGIAPLFGMMADRVGALNTIFFGQVQLLASAFIIILWPDNQLLVTTSLILLGTGWSSAMVAGSAMLNQHAPLDRRVTLQGRGDMFMNVAGAFGAATAGPMMSFIGYVGLAWVMIIPIGLMAVMSFRVLGVYREERAHT